MRCFAWDAGDTDAAMAAAHAKRSAQWSTTKRHQFPSDARVPCCWADPRNAPAKALRVAADTSGSSATAPNAHSRRGLQALLSRNVASVHGRLDFVRVRLEDRLLQSRDDFRGVVEVEPCRAEAVDPVLSGNSADLHGVAGQEVTQL